MQKIESVENDDISKSSNPHKVNEDTIKNISYHIYILI